MEGTVDKDAYTKPYQLTKSIIRDTIPYIISDSNPDNDQSGKIVVITGGGSGIGAAAARVWVRACAEGVIIAGRRQDRLEATCKSLRELASSLNLKTTILGVPTDLTIEDQVQNLFSTVKKQFGRAADVVIANAGWVSPLKNGSEEDVKTWWAVYEINVLGLHNTVVYWIRSQDDSDHPFGTVININSGLAGSIVPGVSAYGSAKLAAHRYMEFVAAEYPSIRSFTMMPGIVKTDLVGPEFLPYAWDEAELTGSLALYLATSRADYLKGSLTSINWDVEEMEANKQQIADGLLKIKWVSVLPCSGGEGL